MLSRAQSITVILLTAFSIYIGYAWFWPRSNASLPSPSTTHSSSSATNHQSTQHHSRLSKSPDHDSAFSTYNNPEYGFSFRYPRNDSLTEDSENFGEDSQLKTQQQLAAEQPGLLLLASVEIPDDAYPNTTFVAGHLQFAVNPASSEPVCRYFAAVDDSDTHDPSLRDTTGAQDIHGIVFDWRQSHNFVNHVDYFYRDYFGYAKGSCYEFFLEVSDTVPLDPDPVVRPADSPKILHTLEKIVSTFQLHSAAQQSSTASKY